MMTTNQVLARMKWSRSTLHRKMVDEGFPRPATTEGTRSYWKETDVEEWEQVQRWRGVTFEFFRSWCELTKLEAGVAAADINEHVRRWKKANGIAG